MGVSSCSVIGDFWPVVHRESRILRVGSDPWNNACRASCTHPFVVHRATFSEENTKNVNFPGTFAPLDLPLILKLSSYRTHETTSTVIDSHSLGLVIVVNIQGGFVPPGPTSYTETNKTIWLAAWSTTTVICSHSLSSVIFVNFQGGGGGGGGGASPPWTPTYTETNKTIYMAAWSTTSYLLAFPCLGYLRQYSGGLHVKGQKCLVVHRDRTPPPPPLPHRHPR